jgi:putative cardiolipin synthase
MRAHSGVRLLADDEEALLARLALAANAAESIDVQYYIWTGDAVGIAVIKQLLLAALRGVRVRLLVDDIHFIGYDRRVLGLDVYDNVEIRAFNPLRHRFRESPFRSMAEIISGVSRLNHRMHNKVFAVDGSAAIIGGRNLSNEYFSLHSKFNFRDIDVLINGPAAAEIVQSFDEYWHSEWAIPLKVLHKRRIKPLVLKGLQEGLSDQDRVLFERINALPTKGYFKQQESKSYRCDVEVLVDAPRKIKGRAGFVSPLRRRLFELNDAANEEILIENGYFIPGEEGLGRLREQTARGVQVKVLTNSLASNDTGLSHAGYRRYRERLLRAGVELYELRVDAALPQNAEAQNGLEVGLHSKAATMDRTFAFVGSYNLDQRSATINTEIGVVVHDKQFAQELTEFILNGMARNNSWWLRLAADDTLQWQHDSHVGGEPPAPWRKRMLVGLLSVLPIERQL